VTGLNCIEDVFCLPVQEGKAPEGSRGARIVWAVNMKYLVVSGFER